MFIGSGEHGALAQEAECQAILHLTTGRHLKDPLQQRGIAKDGAQFGLVEPCGGVLEVFALLDLGACRRKRHLDRAKLAGARNRKRAQMRGQ